MAGKSSVVRELLGKGAAFVASRLIREGQPDETIFSTLSQRFPNLSSGEVQQIFEAGRRTAAAAQGVQNSLAKDPLPKSMVPVFGSLTSGVGTQGQYVYEVDVPWKTSDGQFSGRFHFRFVSDTPLSLYRLTVLSADAFKQLAADYSSKVMGYDWNQIDLTQIIVTGTARGF